MPCGARGITIVPPVRPIAYEAAHSRGDLSAHDMNCHVQVIAHPSKMDSTRRGRVPELEEISGSKNWDNMVDQGFVVHRPRFFEDGVRQTETEFWHCKSPSRSWAIRAS